jgi:hypothetical protein
MSEWQTIALYLLVGLLIASFLWRWHTSERFANFTLVDMIAEDGKLSSRKFMEVGAWVVASIAFIVLTIRGTITEGWLLAYVGAFVVGRLGGQAVHAYSETTTRKAEIMRGRRGDLFSADNDPPDEPRAQFDRRG